MRFERRDWDKLMYFSLSYGGLGVSAVLNLLANDFATSCILVVEFAASTFGIVSSCSDKEKKVDKPLKDSATD